MWDSSAGWWDNPRQFGGYGGLLAVSIFDARAEPGTAYRRGARTVIRNVWLKLKRDRGECA